MHEDRLRVLLVCHSASSISAQSRPFREALHRHFEIREHHVEDGWPTSVADFRDYNDFDVIAWFVRFRLLSIQHGFDWRDFSGRRVWVTWDAHQDFARMTSGELYGLWPDVFRRMKFQTLVCTGRRTADHFGGLGIDSAFIPKAFPGGKFSDLGLGRSGYGFYGTHYHSRAAMLDYLRHHRVPVETLKVPFDALNRELNRYAGIVTCNLQGIVTSAWSRALHRLRPRWGVRLEPGPELMLRNFEVAASGCCGFCDEVPEMSELGFVDGETVLTYRSFDELVEKMRYYKNSPELVAIGKRAAQLAADRHTWDHRMAMFRAVFQAAP
ncbi:MAG: glycosyltransferase [Gemmatimonadota bacterium]|nr:glycosyltransferase [Gemmatimonadota bacterium]